MRIRLGVLLLLTTSAALAQSRETINVSVVEVPVTVVDRSGNPVRGLKASNFEIYDGGQKRAVTAFDSIDFASTESVRTVSPMNPAARRTFMLLFDMTFSRPGSITRAQEAARNFLAHGLQRRDLVSVGTLDADRGFRLLTNFTTDRTMVANAIADPRGFKSTDPLQIASDPQMTIDTTPTSPTGGGGRFGAADEAKEIAAVSAGNDDRFKRQRIDRQMSGLASLAKTLSAVPGRKQILFLSEGFDPRLVQGRGPGERADQAAENEAVLRGQSWTVDTDNRYGSSESQSNIERMAQFFRRSDVVLNAVDIQGVRVQNDSQRGAIVNSNEGLSLLALPTGGTVFKNSNDISNDLDRVLKQQEVVYILAFQAPTSTPGKAHDLKVKLVDVPGGARATYRSAYYEAGGESAVERTLTNAEIVLNDIPTSDVHVSVLAAPFPTQTSSAQVPVIVEIDGNDLVRFGKNNAATVELYIYAFDEQGVVRDSLFQKITLDLAKVGENLKTSGVKYYGTLSLGSGSYAIKTLVRVTESDHKGYARRDVVVGQDSDVAVSQPFFFEPAGKWLMVKGSSHDKTNAPYPFAIGGEPFIPSAGVRFKNGEPRMFAVFVYGATPDEVTVETSPSATLRSATRTADGRGGKMTFQLDKAPASTSALTVTVKKNGSTDARTSSVPITVQ